MATLYYESQYFTTTLSVVGGINDTITTAIVLQSVTGINDTTKPGIALFSYADPLDTATAEWITFTSINSTTKTLVGVTRGQEGYGAKSHNNGVVVAFPHSKSHINELNKLLDGGGTGAVLTSPSVSSPTIIGTPVLNADSAVPFYNDSLSRQAIINGNFDVWQRGTSLATPTDLTAYYLADRWYDIKNDDGGTSPTLTRSRQLLTSGDVENSFYHTRLVTNGAGTSLGNGSFHDYINKIEHGTRLLCGLGKKVTLSFWARSDIANKKIGVYLGQNYGTTGSPTADEYITGDAWTLTSTWTEYTHTFTTNTLVGKTFGTSNNDFIAVSFRLMWGSNQDGFVGETTAETYVGSGYIDIAQVQLCAGDVALPFQPKSYEEELRACQRYTYGITTASASELIAYGHAISTTVACVSMYLPSVMRATPTINVTATDWQLADGVGAAVDLNAFAVNSDPYISKSVISLRATVASGLTQYRPYHLRSDGASKTFLLEAEL